MATKFETFLEKLNIPDELKASINDGYKLLFEDLSSTSSSTGYNLVRSADGVPGHFEPDPTGYNGGHATVFQSDEDEELDGNEGEDREFKFALPGFVGQEENDVEEIKEKFKAFLNKLHGMKGSQLTEAVMSAIDTIH